MDVIEYFESKGVKIDAWQHPASTKRNPIVYGTIGGWSVTAPCRDAEQAKREAQSKLEGNGAWAAWSTHASLPPDPNDADRTAHIARAKELLALLEEAKLATSLSAFDDMPWEEDETAEELKFDQVLAHEAQTAGEADEAKDEHMMHLRRLDQRNAYIAKWPNYCRQCDGAGSHTFYESVPYGSTNVSMPVHEYCEGCTASQAEGPQKCARCGALALKEDGSGPCSECGWNYDSALPERW